MSTRIVPSPLSALAEPLALAVAAGLLDEDEAVAGIEHTAREVLAAPRGAHAGGHAGGVAVEGGWGWLEYIGHR